MFELKFIYSPLFWYPINGFSPLCQCHITVPFLLCQYHITTPFPMCQYQCVNVITGSFLLCQYYITAPFPMCQCDIDRSFLLYQCHITTSCPLCQYRITSPFSLYHCHITDPFPSSLINDPCLQYFIVLSIPPSCPFSSLYNTRLLSQSILLVYNKLSLYISIL